jgi:hypothetical protein
MLVREKRWFWIASIMNRPVHTTKPHNQTHASERKHPQLQENKWRARPDITDSITIEQQQPQ